MFNSDNKCEENRNLTILEVKKQYAETKNPGPVRARVSGEQSQKILHL